MMAAEPQYQLTPYGAWYPCEKLGMYCSVEPQLQGDYILLINNASVPQGTLAYEYTLVWNGGVFTSRLPLFDDGYGWSYVILNFSEEITWVQVFISPVREHRRYERD